MKNLATIFIAAVCVVACSRPSSYEPFMQREKAEYGDTYSFDLDMSDSTVVYGLDFYTRLERPSFGVFPSDSIILDLRWISPSDSIIIDTAYVPVSSPVGSAYYSEDFVSNYSEDLRVYERGKWRLKARIVNDSEEIRGLGVIFKRK